ncbi:MAG: hypothetical protein JKY50_06975 [Oleispira sp.]|nr:hypothetical protein [Oleispira sp.]MBL4881957.1 hypothetical protein [Oleispira sp.]
MKIKIIFVLITLVSMPACSNCLIERDVYVSYGGSEYSTKLELLPKSAFNLEYEIWNPGRKDESEKVITQGEWSCSGKKIELKAGNKTHHSTLTTIGKNPLGIKDDIKVLHFEEGDFKYLSREILYPISVLDDK